MAVYLSYKYFFVVFFLIAFLSNFVICKGTCSYWLNEKHEGEGTVDFTQGWRLFKEGAKNILGSEGGRMGMVVFHCPLPGGHFPPLHRKGPIPSEPLSLLPVLRGASSLPTTGAGRTLHCWSSTG